MGGCGGNGGEGAGDTEEEAGAGRQQGRCGRWLGFVIEGGEYICGAVGQMGLVPSSSQVSKPSELEAKLKLGSLRFEPISSRACNESTMSNSRALRFISSINII
jgi:hypothetical protein